MKHYSLVIDPKLVKQIDKLVKEHGLFSSRSDFIRDAIRARLIEVRKNLLSKELEQPGEEELEKEEKVVEEGEYDIETREEKIIATEGVIRDGQEVLLKTVLIK